MRGEPNEKRTSNGGSFPVVLGIVEVDADLDCCGIVAIACEGTDSIGVNGGTCWTWGAGVLLIGAGCWLKLLPRIWAGDPLPGILVLCGVCETG